MRGIRMKKLCSLLMTLVLLAGCALGESAPEFRRMGDAALLPYLENSLYEQLVSDLDSSDYFVENVQAVYISQEYLMSWRSTRRRTSTSAIRFPN